MLIAEIFSSKNTIKVLFYLYKFDKYHSISELSRELKISKSNISRIVNALKIKGIIIEETKGKTRILRLNRHNFFVKTIIIELFNKYVSLQSEIFKEIIPQVSKHKEVISIIAYGSVLTDSFSFKSDVDFIIVVSKKIKSLDKTLNKIKNKFVDKELILMFDIITLSEVRRLYKKKEPLIISISKEGKRIYGKEFIELIE